MMRSFFFFVLLVRCSYSLQVATLTRGNKGSTVLPPVVGTSTDAVSSSSPVSSERLAGITEPACLDTADRMRTLKVPVSKEVHPSGEVAISFAHWPSSSSISRKKKPPVFLIHGFDSSCLEYRRLGSRLASRGVDTYAVDLLGWGFTQLDGVTSFSARSKIEALQSFVASITGGEDKPFCIAGASLGGAAAIEVAAAACNDDKLGNSCKGLILLDAQGFVDGIGPMAAMPKPIAKLGVEVLKSVPLRSSANQMSYYDKDTFATDEAVIIGRMHCLRDGWSDALVSFMQSGGFSPSTKVPTITAPSLVLWGRQDGILAGEEFANKFVETLPNARLQWIEECGHVPHLEKADETAAAITAFLDEIVGHEPVSETAIKTAVDGKLQIFGIAGAAAAAIAAFAADFLPVH